jgi:CTP:molybdopterin cytidylyltransferase MocA
MGRAKPLLDVGGQAMASRVVSTLRAAGARPIVVVTGHLAEEVEALLAAPDVVFARNPAYAETKMFDSARIGLAAIAGLAARALVTPADVPLFAPSTARRVLQSRAMVAIPVHAGRDGHPVLIDGRAFAQVFENGAEAGLHGAFLALARMGVAVERIGVDDPGAVADADTPADYEALLRLAAREGR